MNHVPPAPMTTSTDNKSLPSDWYTENSYFRLETEHIFRKEWICAGRMEELPRPGDHKIVDCFGESILIIRNQQDQLNAFYNVCRHRGTQLCPGKQKEQYKLKGGVVNRKFIMCPYHAWMYDLDGKLVTAPFMKFEGGCKKEDLNLYPVALETWGGFIFINLSNEKTPDFRKSVKPLTEKYSRYPLSELKTGKKISYTIHANWKIICENYNECYHCGPVHPELCKIVPAFTEQGSANLDWEKGIPHKEGAYTYSKTGTTDRRPFPDLNSDEKERHKGEVLYPNLFLSLSCDHVTAFVLKPESEKLTKLDCYFLFESCELAKATFDAKSTVEFWDLVNIQDWSICERVQSGMKNRIHEQGFFSPMEDWNLDIRPYVTSRIGRYL